MSTIDQLKEFFVSNCLIPQDHKIADDQSLLEGGIIDSLGILELTSFIEQTYRIKINEHDLIPENFDSFVAISNYIEARLSSQ